MKKEHLQKLRNVAAKVNPFLLVDKQTKTPLVYVNDEDAYYDVFVKLLFAFPRGYMDLTLFMVEYMDIPLSDAELYCGRNQVFYFPLYDVDYNERKDRLRSLLITLLKVSNVEFNEQTYQCALVRFNTMILENDYKNKIENGSILDFVKTYGEDNEINTSRY